MIAENVNNPFKFMSIHYQDLEEPEMEEMMSWLYCLLNTPDKGRISCEQFNRSSRNFRLQIIKRLIDINSLKWDSQDITRNVSRRVRAELTQKASIFH